jgi:cytochrome c oxidase subunit 2
MVIFVWGASVFFAMTHPPAGTLDIYVVGKQWMWKFQHLDGQREINELHVPLGRDVKLIATSEDVIHDVFVPAFRIKADVIPGRYVSLWFRATRPGRYHLFCAEYCGTKHSGMTGEVIVMEPAEYQAWLSGGTQGGSLADAGQKLFNELACNTCHRPDAQGRGPVLDGLLGKTVALQSGEMVVADEAYLRESILNPSAKITAGYQPIMPTFQGLVSEEQLLQLIEYVKSLQTQKAGQ